MSRTLRYLRIAWTAFFGIAALLFCVLWVRSYTTNDVLFGPWPAKRSLEVTSAAGVLWTNITVDNDEADPWSLQSGPIDQNGLDEVRDILRKATSHGFTFRKRSSAYVVAFPDYFLLLISVTLAIAPWLGSFPSRFSLRTLLIATTLVAAALGLIVWSLK